MAASASFSPVVTSGRACGKGGGSSFLTFVDVKLSYYHIPVRKGRESEEYSLPFMHQKKSYWHFPSSELTPNHPTPPTPHPGLPEAGIPGGLLSGPWTSQPQAGSPSQDCAEPPCAHTPALPDARTSAWRPLGAGCTAERVTSREAGSGQCGRPVSFTSMMHVLCDCTEL